MRPILPLAALVTLLAGAACQDASAPSAASLVGEWRTETLALQPQGSMHHTLTFTGLGRFAAEWRSHGVYEGQAAGALSAYGRTTGVYRVEGDRLVVAPMKLVSWDSFHPPEERLTVQEPYPYGPLFDGARFTVDDGVLTLRYRGIGPADEPVDATVRFVRER